MSVGTTYSFKDFVGVISNPVLGVTIPLTGGNVGIGSITFIMEGERTVHDVSADGTIMPSYVSVNNGRVTIEAQQTSVMHKELLNLYNLAVNAAEQGAISGWAATAISAQTLLDGSSHKCTGVSFAKNPDKPYQAHGQKITWTLMAADMVSTGSTIQTSVTSILSGLGV